MTYSKLSFDIVIVLLVTAATPILNKTKTIEWPIIFFLNFKIKKCFHVLILTFIKHNLS